MLAGICKHTHYNKHSGMFASAYVSQAYGAAGAAARCFNLAAPGTVLVRCYSLPTALVGLHQCFYTSLLHLVRYTWCSSAQSYFTVLLLAVRRLLVRRLRKPLYNCVVLHTSVKSAAVKRRYYLHTWLIAGVLVQAWHVTNSSTSSSVNA